MVERRLPCTTPAICDRMGGVEHTPCRLDASLDIGCVGFLFPEWDSRIWPPWKAAVFRGPCDGNTQGGLIQLPVPSRTAWESLSQGLRHRELQKEWPGDFSQGAAVETMLPSAQAKCSTVHEFSLNKGMDHLNGRCYHPENVSLCRARGMETQH